MAMNDLMGLRTGVIDHALATLSSSPPGRNAL
jgi:hypothetical protein